MAYTFFYVITLFVFISIGEVLFIIIVFLYVYLSFFYDEDCKSVSVGGIGDDKYYSKLSITIE